MSRARVGMAAALLAACGVAGIARAGNVDIFPSQSWDSLSRAREARTDKDRTRMRTRRPPRSVLVRPGGGRRRRCSPVWASGANGADRGVAVRGSPVFAVPALRRHPLRPAARPGYRLKSLEPDRAVLLAPDGREAWTCRSFPNFLRNRIIMISRSAATAALFVSS